MPGLTLGDTVPNLEVETTAGKFRLYDYIGADGWVILFSHPVLFLSAFAADANKFAERGVKLLGLSCDDVQSHKEWIKDIEAYNNGHKVNYPIIADPNRELIKQLLNMVDPDEKDPKGREIKLSFLYPASTGRNLDEVLRVLDSLQKKAAKHKVATPANWKPGEPVVISPSLMSNEEAKYMFPQGYESADLPSKKDYLRFTNVSEN